MSLQAVCFPSVRDRVEVQREGVRLGEQVTGQGADPRGQQTPLLLAPGPVGILRWKVFLGKTFRLANRPSASSELKSLT